MNPLNTFSFELKTESSVLKAEEAVWDSLVFDAKVFQIHEFRAENPSDANNLLSDFMQWAKKLPVGIVSCRLSHDKLVESMALEDVGFRFIEMVHHPYYVFDKCSSPSFAGGIGLEPASLTDVEQIRAIAENSFSFERFHIDPRIDSSLANIRYGNWVDSALNHPTQKLFKVIEKEEILGFFVVEYFPGSKVYWHLTAIDAKFQGKGYGFKAWNTVLQQHALEGVHHVNTTISARNVRVLNLYARLGFRFKPPEMTFHWVK